MSSKLSSQIYTDQQLANLNALPLEQIPAFRKLCGLPEHNYADVLDSSIKKSESNAIADVSVSYNTDVTLTKAYADTVSGKIVLTGNVDPQVKALREENERLKQELGKRTSLNVNDIDKICRALEEKTEECNRLRGGVTVRHRNLRLMPTSSKKSEYLIDGKYQTFTNYSLETPEGLVEHLLVYRVCDKTEYQSLNSSALDGWAKKLSKHFGKPIMVVATPPGVELTLTDIIS